MGKQSGQNPGELPEEESNGVASEEEIFYKEPSMYDKLLMALGSSSKAVAAAYNYDFYSFSIIPTLGELVAGDRESYQYLVESIRRFPPQETFASMIADAGFQKVEYENLVGGVVAIHSGLKI